MLRSRLPGSHPFLSEWLLLQGSHNRLPNFATAPSASPQLQGGQGGGQRGSSLYDEEVGAFIERWMAPARYGKLNALEKVGGWGSGWEGFGSGSGGWGLRGRAGWVGRGFAKFSGKVGIGSGERLYCTIGRAQWQAGQSSCHLWWGGPQQRSGSIVRTSSQRSDLQCILSEPCEIPTHLHRSNPNLNQI